MNVVNWVVLFGLSAAGLALMVGHAGLLSESPTATLFTFGTVVGWLFGVAAVLVYLIGAITHLLGRLKDLWGSVLPANLGLTILGVSFLSFRPEVISLWGIGVALGVLLAALLYAFHAATWRPLAIVVLLPLVALQTVPTYLSPTLIQVAMGTLLIALPVMCTFSRTPRSAQ